MPRLRGSSLIAAVLAATSPLWLRPAAAQFGLYTLPQNNFIWNWGDTAESGKRRGISDLDLDGGEAGFQCHLSARLRASASMTSADTRQLENDLRTRLDFIYASSQEMNYLDQMRQLDWATLDCRKPEPGPVDEEKRTERESAAREKMLRELERRRARQQRDDGGN
jgi:hypothetical protein